MFADGRNTKIETYAVEADLIHLTLQGGGKLSLPLTRIERIVDDEIVPAEVVAEVKKIVEEQGGVFPKRSWRYSERSKPLCQSKYNEIIVAAAQQVRHRRGARFRRHQGRVRLQPAAPFPTKAHAA